MALTVALLRGVNVGGRKLVSMQALRGLCQDLGLGAPRSLLQSGNLVFETGLSEPALETLLRSEAASRLGLATRFIIRSQADWRDLIDANPLIDLARADPSRFVVFFLKSEPSDFSVQALQEAKTGPETLRVDGRQLYIAYPDGIGRSRLTNAVIERRLGAVGTARNWNTVMKIASALEPPEA